MGWFLWRIFCFERWHSSLAFWYVSSTHKYLFFTEFLSAVIGASVGKPKRQCAVCALAYKKYDLKTIEVVARGTKQKTEDFCWLLSLPKYAKNWVLFCGELISQRFFSCVAYSDNIHRFFFYLIGDSIRVLFVCPYISSVPFSKGI